MEPIAMFFIYIGCLLSVLLVSFIFGGLASLAFEFDIFKCAWVVASVILALFFAAEMWKEVF